MSQHYFRFKRFTIQQERCAMKVCTDACIQGAWTPIGPSVKHVLDIGAGTGLLALMLAQRAPRVLIDAVEIDQDAARQMRENIAASPFAGRIKGLQADAVNYCARNLYDLIICNPPFFSQDLKGPEAARNNVRHDALLNAWQIIRAADRNLSPDGMLSIMWPERRQQEWEMMMHYEGWRPAQQLNVRNTTGARISTVISCWSREITESPEIEQDLIVRETKDVYSAEFTALLKDFYLKL